MIASLADVILIDVRPLLGVFLVSFVHRWQNQTCDGKWSDLPSSAVMQLLWKVRLHSAHAREFILGSSLFCWEVSFLHLKSGYLVLAFGRGG